MFQILRCYIRSSIKFRKKNYRNNENQTTRRRVRSFSGSSSNYLVDIYQQMVELGKIQSDPLQILVLQELDRLRNQLFSYSNLQESDTFSSWDSIFTSKSTKTISTTGENIGDDEEKEFSMSSLWGKFFTLNSSSPSFSTSISRSPKGVYIHGGVGCGKTFCMNLFYDSLPQSSMDLMSSFPWGKQKVHFHKFMLGIHQQMHQAKRVQGIQGDVLPRVIENTIKKGRIICFDEFQVTDVADALILRRLFTGLLERDAVIVATSNRPPRDLYLNGLQRDLFLPFIGLLEERTQVISMWKSEVDYRLIQGENKARGVYFVGSNSICDFERVFMALTKSSSTEPMNLSLQGRIVHIPQASMTYGVARFTFDSLCGKAKGAADYLLIGETFHTVFVEQVPVLTVNAINQVRRFIIFIDAMYECHVKLIIHAATPPEGIFQVDLENKFIDEVFAFDRTRSRLEEMSSDQYLQKKWYGKET